MNEAANGFLARLKQRKLVQWALAYIAFAFALIQVLDVVASQFDWPESLRRGITLALAVGFVVALVVAWYHGEKGRQRVSGAELLLIALVLAIGGGIVWQFGSPTRSPDAAQRNPGNTAPDFAADAAASGLRSASSASSAQAVPIPAKSIAVLPFENLSEDKGNAYFADGMQDLILTKLADIGDLKVISRTSTAQYQSHPDNLKAIAQQLGVATILEGSVQKAGNQVLINVQLIDARSDNHLWAEAYTRTLDNIFGVEGEVAQKVADALKAKLTHTEQLNVAAVPTQNAAAYDEFLKAESLAYKARDSSLEADFSAADAVYRKAIALDPGFALAYARLAYNQIAGHWFAKHLSPERLDDIKSAIDRALALAPQLPDAHLALAYYYYWGFRRYDDAVTEFRRTLQLAPNNEGASQGLAYILRRRGKFDQALMQFQHVLTLAPGDRENWSEYGITYEIVRRYPEALQQLNRALAIDPDYEDARGFGVRALLFGFGDVSKARVVSAGTNTWRLTYTIAGDSYNLIGPRAYPDFFDRNFDAALRDWDAVSTTTEDERLISRVARVTIAVVAGRRAAVRPECEKLKPLLDADLAQNPDALGPLQRLSWVEVCLGQDAEAIATARHASEVLPLEKDAYFGAFQLEALAEIEAHAGRPAQAIDLIRQLLAIPAGETMSIIRLERDPIWDPLRNDSRFQALLKQ
ncbi:MAG: tetratricopeptide repeat protein, partial [Rhodanobacteraceae bacterium]